MRKDLLDKLHSYNHLPYNDFESRDKLILDILGKKGKNTKVTPPVYFDYGKHTFIGHNVWIGGNAVVMPGVTIGDNTVIGAGSVVTKDIPSDVIAAGNPCKVIRKINNSDKLYWKEKQKQYEENL